MKFLQNLLYKRYSWAILVLLLVLVNWLASQFHSRIDLTSEKRYSLSQPTQELLHRLDSTVTIDVYLKGEFPAVFKKLQHSTRDLLQEMKEYGGQHFIYRFVKPGEGMPDTAQTAVYDSLEHLGLKPYNVKVSSKPGEENSERLIFPAAIVRYGTRIVPVDLLSGSKGTDAEASMNNAESLLEFKIADAIDKLTRINVPRLVYLTGNGELAPPDMRSFDIVATLSSNYILDTVNLQQRPFLSDTFDAVLINKPTVRFSDADKLKIDQYILHGGKVMWMVDNLYAEMDSLKHTNQFIAFDRGLNLEDQLFKYGARINQDLVQDIQQSDEVPLVVGNAGGQPQTQMVPWPYFPLLTPSNNSPISRNLEPVLSIFANSIDTIKSEGVKKTILLTTSDYARRLSTPAIVSWESVKQQPDPAQYREPQIPVGVLLEGKFHSLYENRLSTASRDTLNSLGRPFLPTSNTDGKIIIIADGDIFLNALTERNGPIPMGTNPYTNYQFANKDFFLNCLEYLTNPKGIIESRNKQLVLRNLDKQKVEDERTQWQLINILLPILLIIGAGLVYQQLRKRKYQR